MTNTARAPAQLVSIAVTPTNSSLVKGLDRQFIATGTYTDASAADLTLIASWASSTAVATISSAGLAHAVSPGSTTISATLGSVVGSTGLTVTFILSGCDADGAGNGDDNCSQ